MKKKSYKFFNEAKNVKSYTSMYERRVNIDEIYPANAKRLEIIINLLKKYKPHSIVDAGCGSGKPLIKIKKMGFNIIGYDKAKNMVIEAKKNLKKNKLNENLIFIDNFEKPLKNIYKSTDCILGMGAFYYSRNFEKTMKIQISKLKKNGRIIFSLRNELFNISTFNSYTLNFFSKLYEINKQSFKVKKKFFKIFDTYDNRNKISFKNIDDRKVFSNMHNPLTIEKQLEKLNIKVNGIYYYHFHHLPPLFENIDKKKFRIKSLQIEKPLDWRGALIASAFVIDGQKI